MSERLDEGPEPSDDGSGELPEEGSALGAIVEQVVTLVVAIAIALAIRQFLIEPFRIPSGSMFPTLLIGDHLFVNKLAYGPRIPFTDVRLPGWREPERGDVVVFEVGRPLTRSGQEIMPLDLVPSGTRSEDFVKRIVGLPGDTIEWKRGQLFVNDALVDRGPLPDRFVDPDGRSHARYWEQLGACRHEMLDDAAPVPNPRMDRGGPFRVEPGRYFMMGDNRDNSNDSRGWGTVRLEELKGPAFILYWSWDVNGNMLSFFNPLNWWSAEKRWDRIFDRVECDDGAAATATAE